MIEILAHRGFWTRKSEHNSSTALLAALDRGWGLEFDVRDHEGDLVISHDMPTGAEMTLEALFAAMTESRRTLPLAINVKADGLADRLRDLLSQFSITNYFVFDMAVPDMRVCLNAGLTAFTRHSEQESHPSFLDSSKGIWLDSFTQNGADIASGVEFATAGKQVAVVSPELHGHEHCGKWHELLEAIHSLPTSAENTWMLCTDLPEEAELFFGVPA